jgi:hypothetical protein
MLSGCLDHVKYLMEYMIRYVRIDQFNTILLYEKWGFSNMAIFAFIPIFGILNNMVTILPPHLVLKKSFLYQYLIQC